MDGIKAIPCMYDGVQFRSQLEAKWAMLFDRLAWPWLYEPVAYAGWIPDFVLTFPHAPLVVEVKPFDRPRGVEIAAYREKIDRAGCPHDVLLAGACGPWPERHGGDDDSVVVGLLRGAPHEGWAAGLLTGCRGHLNAERPCPEPTGSIGLFHGAGVFRNRRCGCYEGNHYLDRVEWREIKGLWRTIGNAVQWMPQYATAISSHFPPGI